MSHDARNGFPNSTPAVPLHLSDYQDTLQHRLRHVTSIQIRNLTPFPARDALASALLQPASHSQFTVHGHHSDDLDVTVARKRSRRVSTSSVNTLRSIRAEASAPFAEGSPPAVSIPDMRGRRRTQSKVSFSSTPIGNAGSGSKPSRAQPPSPTIHPSRPSFRNRTSSMASGNIPSASALSIVPSSSTYSATNSFFIEYNQKKLEEVVDSRLVESFIAITVPSRMNRVGSRTKSASGSRPSSPAENPGSTRARTQSRDNGSSSRSKEVKAFPAKKDSPGPSKSATKFHKSSLSMPSKAGPSQPPMANGTRTMDEDGLHGVPDYMSPIHRPSTNPTFTIDGRSSYEFADWTDRSADYFRVQLWAKTGNQTNYNQSSSKGKGKEKGPPMDELEGWKVLEEWDVHLPELVPLTEELSQNQFNLPSNTLLVTFSSSNATFYLPKSPSTGRSRSPSLGYTSDPEATTAAEDLAFPRHNAKLALPKLQMRQRSRKISGRSSSWQDLLQLATLQACIRDNQQSLNKIVNTVSDSLRADAIAALMRDVSERETRIRDRQDDRSRIMNRSDELRELIVRKKESLRNREVALSSAKELMDERAARLSDDKLVLTEERKQLMFLRNQLTPLRTRLIATLSFIFPIDLRSPEDLLYTILSVPLPIPMNKTDPAPPLSWPTHKDVSEDSVATALGYAALTIHLLAAYTGKALVYPITYIGSRSLIRDNISAMVGPRMFPLFSKGVDTYRFEYGVFLLNKNIELLMVDKTPTMDIRHTLFNLKNLLLILSDGECAPSAPLRVSESPMSFGLVTPPPQSPPSLTLDTEATGSEANGNADTSSFEDSQVGDVLDSGAVTPTASSSDGSAFSRYSRISIGLPQLPGFWRSRTSSSITPPVKREAENGRPVQANGSATNGEASTGQLSEQSRDDEDDRRTIRGLSMDHGDGTDARKRDVKTPTEAGAEKSAKEVVLQEDGLTSSVPAR